MHGETVKLIDLIFPTSFRRKYRNIYLAYTLYKIVSIFTRCCVIPLRTTSITFLKHNGVLRDGYITFQNFENY